MAKYREHGDFQDYVLQKLQNPRFALLYLNEALKDEDQRHFLLALKNVLEAQYKDTTTI